MVDKELCKLVERLRGAGYRHTLEVELRLAMIEVDPNESDLAMFLPEFKEKGVVTILESDSSGKQRIIGKPVDHSRALSDPPDLFEGF